MKKSIGLIYLLVINFTSFQSFAQPRENIGMPVHKINNTLYSSIKTFIPKDYVLLDQVDGDLNCDGLVDKILILKLINEITEEEKRPVLLLLRQKDNSFKIAEQNNNIVLSLGDGGIHGDPYYGIVIKEGYFSIEHFGGSSWRWSQVITFKYNKSKRDWYLYKIGDENWHMDRSNHFEAKKKTIKDFGEVLFADYINKWRDADK